MQSRLQKRIRIMSGYRNYSYDRDGRDRAIAIAVQCVRIYAALSRLSFHQAAIKIERATGVSRWTIRGWADGRVTSPRHATLASVVLATGGEVDVRLPDRPRGLRLIRGGRAA